MVLDCVPSARGKGGSGEVGVDEEVVSSEGMSREQAQRPYPRTELGGGGVGRRSETSRGVSGLQGARIQDFSRS